MFGADGAGVNMECVESCTDDYIVNACNDRKGCMKPKMLDGLGKIDCTDKTTVLYHKELQKFYKYGIFCENNEFKMQERTQDTPIKIPRITLKEKMEVACVSKCDELLTKRDANLCPGPKCIEDTLDGEGNRMLQCTDPSHYIQFENGVRVIPAPTCKPTVGWSVPGKIVVNFANNEYEAKVDCANACHNRIEAKCTVDEKFCPHKQSGPQKVPIVPYDSNTKEYSCPKTHIMRVEKGGKYEKMLDEVLECKKEGLSKKTDKLMVFQFDPATLYTAKLTVECTSKCHPMFVTMTPSDQRKNIANNENLECINKHHVLLINDVKRVFGALKCHPQGWKVNNDIIAPFDTTVDVKAECVPVCAAESICDDTKLCKHIAIVEGQPLPCGTTGTTFALFLNDEETSGSVVCTREGWIERTSPVKKLVDFADTNIQIKDHKVRVECRRLCAPALIEDKCVNVATDKCKKIENFRDLQPITCGTQGTFALYVNDQKTSEKVLCTREGWTEDNLPGPPKVIVDFKNAAEASPNKVRVECRRLCGTTVFEDLCVTPAGGMCTKISVPDLPDRISNTHLVGDTCTNSNEHALFVNGVVRSGKVTCSKDGWTDSSGPIVDFKDPAFAPPVKVQALCRQVCGTALIENKCENEQQDKCKKAVYSTREISCGSLGTFALFVNDKATTGKVMCTRDGWTETVGTQTTNIVDFKAATDALESFKVRVECRKICGTDGALGTPVIDDLCKDETEELCKKINIPEVSPHVVAARSCPRDTHTLFVNDVKMTGEVVCKREGWFEKKPPAPEAKIVDFAVPGSHPVHAVCRQQCDKSLIDDVCEHLVVPRKCKKIETFEISDRKVTCDPPSSVGPSNFALFVNDQETTGEVKCTTDGWTENNAAATTKIVPFTGTGQTPPPKVNVECRHKCHPHFVSVDDICTATDESCSKAAYDSTTGELTCSDLENEILVIENDGKPNDVFEGKATCDKDSGWPTNPTADKTKFAVRAKCLKVCHPSTLDAENGSRNYSMGRALTCDDPKEMLVFNTNEIYSDATCSKEGWKKVSDGKEIMGFAANIDRAIAAKCEQNKCIVRKFSDPCKGDDASLCEKPDLITQKYKMSCAPPLVIRSVKYQNINMGDLVCRDGGKWFEGTEQKFDADVTTEIDVKCFAEKCASGSDVLEKINCGADSNCRAIKFKAGRSSYCNSYECDSGFAFKIASKSGGAATYKLPANDRSKIWCNGNDEYEYKSTDRTSGVETKVVDKANDKVGCVKQIPCTEVSPLNTACPTNVDCDLKLIDKLRESETLGSDSRTKKVTCDGGFAMYHHVSGDDWQSVSSLQCTQAGKWSAILNKATTPSDLAPNARITCTASNPTIIVTTTPPPAPLCVKCRADADVNMWNKKCADCLEKPSDLTSSIDGERCWIKSGPEVLIYVGDTAYTEIQCSQKGDVFEWKTKSGEAITGKFSAKKGKLGAKANSFLIIGVVVAVFVLIGAIAAAIIIFFSLRKKRAYEREQLKTKGLTQKIDTIIDEVSVTDDVKTLVL